MSGNAAAPAPLGIGGEIRLLASLLRQEVAGMAPSGPRARHATTAALAVLLAVAAAQWLHLPQPAWAGISAFVSTQATAPAALRRGVLRLIGTAAGATVGVLLAPWLLYDQVAGMVVLMLAGFVGVLGFQVSSHGYAWMLFGVTIFLVVLGAVSDPPSALATAINRTLEVVVGTATAMAATNAIMPHASAPVPSPPGWRDLAGAQWPAVAHSVRAAVAIALVPAVWVWLDLPGLSQMAVTIIAVMAVPTLTGKQAEDSAMLLRRGLHRVGGCIVGGSVALALLSLSLQGYLPWLIALGATVWAGTYIHAAAGGISYVGTQAVVVFIVTLVQGWGPPDSIQPAFLRLVGIFGGLTILLVITLLLSRLGSERDRSSG